MKKSVVVLTSLLLLLALSTGTSAETFEWQLFVQGGDDHAFNISSQFSGARFIDFISPVDNYTHLRNYTQWAGKSGGGSCSVSKGYFISNEFTTGYFPGEKPDNSNVIAWGVSGQGTDDTITEEYPEIKTVITRHQGNSKKTSTGRTCGYSLLATLNYAILINEGKHFTQAGRTTEITDSRIVNGQRQDLSTLKKFLEQSPHYSLVAFDPDKGHEWKVRSTNPRVKVFFDDNTEEKSTSTASLSAISRVRLHACEDFNQNDECDTNEVPESCKGDDKAWLALKGIPRGLCCGLNLEDTVDTTPYGSEGEATNGIVDSQSYLDEDKKERNALESPVLCAEDPDGNPVWISLDQLGKIHHIAKDSRETKVVSDGEKFYHCPLASAPFDDDEITGSKGLDFQDLDTITVPISGIHHSFHCKNGQITECTGAIGGQNTLAADPDNNKNGIVTKPGGIADTKDGDQYCKDDGSFGIDLDESPVACSQAPDKENNNGFSVWTGTRCCSEDLDTSDGEESYNDPVDPDNKAAYAQSYTLSGGCYKGSSTSESDFLDNDKKIINAQGIYYSCGPVPGEFSTRKDNTAKGPLVQEATTCQKLELGTKTDVAVCQEWGGWTFSDNRGNAIMKEAPPVNTDTLSDPDNFKASGCCAADECWNGYDCLRKESFYQLGGQGYRCE